VAYGDNLRPSGFFPTPWKGAPNTLFIGNGPTFDAGAIRLDNPTGAPLPVDNVSVDLMYGLPAQGAETWTRSVHGVLLAVDSPSIQRVEQFIQTNRNGNQAGQRCLHTLNQLAADLLRESLRLEEGVDRLFLIVREQLDAFLGGRIVQIL